MKIYIKANSKAAINRGLADGDDYLGYNYSMFGGGGAYYLRACPVGTLIAVYTKMQGGNPIAKSWGTWNGVNLD